MQTTLNPLRGKQTQISFWNGGDQNHKEGSSNVKQCLTPWNTHFNSRQI